MFVFSCTDSDIKKDQSQILFYESARLSNIQITNGLLSMLSMRLKYVYLMAVKLI